jgi:hypothetical protein
MAAEVTTSVDVSTFLEIDYIPDERHQEEGPEQAELRYDQASEGEDDDEGAQNLSPNS